MSTILMINKQMKSNEMIKTNFKIKIGNNLPRSNEWNKKKIPELTSY